MNVPIASPRSSLDLDEREFRKRALRDACLCIGWFKMISVTCYVSMFYLVKLNSSGDLAFIIQVLLLLAMLPSIFQGLLLFLGALQESKAAITLALYICVLLATYDIIIGVLGAAYHMFIATTAVHYILTLAFILLAMTSFPTYCHDAYIINTYRKVLNDQNIYLN